jgi:hypothetical protein
VDFVLWFLAALGRGLRDGRQPGLFGGPDSTVSQGELARHAGEALVGTPLRALLGEAYDPALRNTIAHNDYRVDEHTCADAEIVDHKTGQRWGLGAVRQRLAAAQILGEAVMVGVMWAHDVQLALDPARLAQRGVVSTAYAREGEPGKMAVLVLSQLWCFRDLDLRGSWLDSSERPGSLTLRTTTAVSAARKASTSATPFSYSMSRASSRPIRRRPERRPRILPRFRHACRIMPFILQSERLAELIDSLRECDLTG